MKSPRGVLYPPFSEYPGPSKLLGKGRGTTDGKGQARAFQLIPGAPNPTIEEVEKWVRVAFSRVSGG